ncbi:FAD-dependent monooxygenase [Variovorax sp. OV329]|uniref:FAD-dependent monooxygenase n=1 Tax=Variovorax sp. OV329 TaxID=1882825 RepID=UPI0008E861D5|nr:FAD-dependent monooxygenase [Variovorax sp. OV329]SFM08300.1 salicylate hydroxylase [Variovorax sp. OV329]
MPARILIAGGGIGGLAAAVALARRGQSVEVLEQAPAFAEIGAGIQLGPNVTRRLKSLDLLDGALKLAARPPAVAVRDAQDGSLLARMPLADTIERKYGGPYLCIHRADLHGVLLEAARALAPRVELSTGVQITQVAARGDTVCVGAGAEHAWEGDGLVGADGLWSLVRRRVSEDAAPPRATGHTAWRALVRIDALPAALRSSEVQVWLGERLHAVAYPVRAGAFLNVVVIAEVQPGGAWVQKPDPADWDQQADLAALLAAIGKRCDGVFPLIEAMPQWRAWLLNDLPPLSGPQDMVRERIALLGDAAHPMLPYLAQGAGMAIEDAVALADRVGTGAAADLPAAFARYAAARWQRNARVQARAQRNGEVFHAGGARRMARDAALRVLGAHLLDNPWLYEG